MSCFLEKLPLELWIAIATELSLGDLSILCEIFSTISSIGSILAEHAIKNLYVLLLAGPAESLLTIHGGQRDSQPSSHFYEALLTSTFPHLRRKNQRAGGLFFRFFLESKRTFTYRSKSKVSMTLRIPNGDSFIGRSRYLDLLNEQPIGPFDITLNLFNHSGHDAFCRGCDVLRLKYMNVEQPNNNSGKGGEPQKNKMNMRAEDMKLKSAIWRGTISHVEYPLPLSWFEGFGQFICMLTEWDEDLAVEPYTRSPLRDLSILFEEFSVPTSKDLLRYFPTEIMEK